MHLIGQITVYVVTLVNLCSWVHHSCNWSQGTIDGSKKETKPTSRTPYKACNASSDVQNSFFVGIHVTTSTPRVILIVSFESEWRRRTHWIVQIILGIRLLLTFSRMLRLLFFVLFQSTALNTVENKVQLKIIGVVLGKLAMATVSNVLQDISLNLMCSQRKDLRIRNPRISPCSSHNNQVYSPRRA